MNWLSSVQAASLIVDHGTLNWRFWLAPCIMPGIGPIAIFDKSALQSFNPDEALWFDCFYKINITPLFYVETLADLHKQMRGGRTPEHIVGSIAYMTPEKTSELRRYLADARNLAYEAELPTKFEDPLGYAIISRLAREIEDAAAQVSLPLPCRPLIGTLPTGRVNAMTIAVPQTDEFVVVFESELFNFANLLSKAVVRSMPFQGERDGSLTFSTEETDVETAINQNPAIVDRFHQVVLAYLLRGRPGAAPQYVPEEPYGRLAMILTSSMELFVLGHEYGHVIRGHLSARAEKGALIAGEAVHELIRNWQQEVEADLVGMQLMVLAMRKRGFDLALSEWGADFFFSCVDIIEKGISVLHTGREDERPHTSHPPPELRRAALREMLPKWVPEHVAASALSLAAVLERILDVLWKSIRPVLYRHYERGDKIASAWG